MAFNYRSILIRRLIRLLLENGKRLIYRSLKGLTIRNFPFMIHPLSLLISKDPFVNIFKTIDLFPNLIDLVRQLVKSSWESLRIEKVRPSALVDCWVRGIRSCKEFTIVNERSG